MSDKKRKKSYTVRMKRKQAAEERQMREKTKKEILIMCLIGVLIIALAFGIVFGGIAIYKSLQDKDYCEYKDDTQLMSNYKRTYTADIKIKDYGTVRVLLLSDAAPLTVSEFVSQAHKNFYDGTKINMFRDGVMVQGGDNKGDGTGTYTDSEGNAVKLEPEFETGVTLEHIRGVFSMVSIDDKNSTSSRFLICTSSGPEATALNGVHTPVGIVISGLSVVDKINEDMVKLSNGNSFISDVNAQIVIESINILDFGGGSDNELPMVPIS